MLPAAFIWAYFFASAFISVVLDMRIAAAKAPESAEVSWRNPVVGAPVGARLLTAVDVAGRCALLVLFPLRLSVEYGHDVVPLVRSAASPSFLASLAVVLGSLAAVGLLARRSAVGRLGAVVAAGSYLLMSHLFFPAPAYKEPQR